MSVALSAAGTGGYMPMQTAMPQMRAPNFNSSNAQSNPVYKISSSASASENAQDLRGDLNGDDCLTLDIDDIISSAIWQERECKCNILPFPDIKHSVKDTESTANNGDIAQYVTECVKKLEQMAISASQGNDTTDTVKKRPSTKNKKKKEISFGCGKGGITLVLGSSVSQSDLRSASASVTTAGFNVKNIFGRGIAAVTGVLARSAKYLGPHNNILKELDMKSSESTNPEEDVVIFYVHVNKAKSGTSDASSSIGFSVDAALISLERGKGIKNNIGFQRLSTLAVADGVSKDASDGGMETIVRDILKQLREIGNIPEAVISAVVIGGNLPVWENDVKRTQAIGRVIKGSPLVYKSVSTDAVLGGCILSAGELDSSKEYLQQADGSWVLVYQLPVADGHISRQVGLFEQENASTPISAEPEIIFSSRRLWKLELGPIKPGSIATQGDGLAKVTKEYVCVLPSAYHKMKRSIGLGVEEKCSTSNIVYEKSGEWPRLVLVERIGLEGTVGTWTKIGGEEILPLGIKATKPTSASTSTSTSDNSKNQINPVDRCTVTFTVSPHTGLVTASEKKGKLLSDRREEYWFWVQVSVCVLSLILLVASPFLYGHFQERSVKAEHILWLKNFYLKHAPEKLTDPDYVERTVRKYKGRMFLLWRGLKRTYNVDFPAPSSILEGVGSDL